MPETQSQEETALESLPSGLLHQFPEKVTTSNVVFKTTQVDSLQVREGTFWNDMSKEKVLGKKISLISLLGALSLAQSVLCVFVSLPFQIDSPCWFRVTLIFCDHSSILNWLDMQRLLPKKFPFWGGGYTWMVRGGVGHEGRGTQPVTVLKKTSHGTLMARIILGLTLWVLV